MPDWNGSFNSTSEQYKLTEEEQLARKLLYTSPNNNFALAELQRRGVSAEAAAYLFARIHTPATAKKGIRNLGIEEERVKPKVVYTPRSRIARADPDATEAPETANKRSQPWNWNGPRTSPNDKDANEEDGSRKKLFTGPSERLDELALEGDQLLNAAYIAREVGFASPSLPGASEEDRHAERSSIEEEEEDKHTARNGADEPIPPEMPQALRSRSAHQSKVNEEEQESDVVPPTSDTDAEVCELNRVYENLEDSVAALSLTTRPGREKARSSMPALARKRTLSEVAMAALEMCSKLAGHLSEQSLLLQEEKAFRMSLQRRVADLEARMSAPIPLSSTPMKLKGAEAVQIITNTSPMKAGGSPALSKPAIKVTSPLTQTPVAAASVVTPPAPNAPVASRTVQEVSVRVSSFQGASARRYNPASGPSTPANTPSFSQSKSSRARRLVFLQPPASPVSSPLTRAATNSLAAASTGGDVVPTPSSLMF